MNCPYCHNEMEEGTFRSRGANFFLPKGSNVTWLSKKNIQNAKAVMPPPDPWGVSREGLVAYCCRNCKKIVIAYTGDNGIYS